jgi:pyruvate dehydrogenase E2 component (dihydrolipoamide acetyltransferase)
MALVEVKVPDIGDFDQVEVIEVLVKVGDTIKAEQSLVTVESDKASMEIPSSHAGVVKELKLQLGDKVSEGTLVLLLEAAAAAASAPAAAAAVEPAPPAPVAAPPVAAAAPLASQPVERIAPTAALPAHEPTAPTGHLPHASPSVRRFARELGVPLAEVKGTGPKERITLEDVQGYVKGVMSGDSRTASRPGAAPASSGGALDLLPWPKVDFAKFGAVQRKDLSRIKKISGANLHRNWVVIPHVTNHDDADITELEAFRVQLNKENEKSGVKVTMLAFLIKAAVAALKKFPEFNTSLDGEQIVLKQYFHIGFAADTPNGLMVPVIKDADQKGILAISKEMSELAGKARDGKLGRDERRLLQHQLARRHRRALLHADHQRARGRDPRRVQERHRAALGRQGVRAAADAAAEPELGPPRDRRRGRRALQRLPGRGAGGFPPCDAVRN